MPIPEFGRAEVGALKSTSVVNLIFFVESQLKVLLPEPLLCFAAEGCSGQRNVLQDVIVGATAFVRGSVSTRPGPSAATPRAWRAVYYRAEATALPRARSRASFVVT